MWKGSLSSLISTADQNSSGSLQESSCSSGQSLRGSPVRLASNSASPWRQWVGERVRERKGEGEREVSAVRSTHLECLKEEGHVGGLHLLSLWHIQLRWAAPLGRPAQVASVQEVRVDGGGMPGLEQVAAEEAPELHAAGRARDSTCRGRSAWSTKSTLSALPEVRWKRSRLSACLQAP